MGNDGGTIARRSDLVHTKQVAKTSLDIDPRLQARNTFASCALSRLPLKQPVVADSLGNLYRKEKVVEFLLKKAELAANGDASGKEAKEMGVAGHLRGLKDVKALKMTESSSKAPDSASKDSDSTTFVCPLTSKVMNGSTGRFVYIRTCGCVLSESGLRAVAGGSQSSKTSSGESLLTIPCPVCSTPFNSFSLSKSNSAVDSSNLNSSDASNDATSSSIPPLFSIQSDLIPIYPPAKELEWLKSKMETERESEKQKKKKEKKKSKTEKNGGEETEIASKSSSEKKRSATQASLNSASTPSKVQKTAAPQQPQTAAQRLALEARQRTEEKKKGSEALRNLYGEDESGRKIIGKQQESWMTKGTFTRYA